MKIVIDTEKQDKLVSVSGVMDALGVYEMGDVLQSAATEGQGDLELDLSNVTFVDTSGLGLLVAIFKRLRAEGRNLVIQNANGQPLDLFKSLKLCNVFHIWDTTASPQAKQRKYEWIVDQEAA